MKRYIFQVYLSNYARLIGRCAQGSLLARGRSSACTTCFPVWPPALAGKAGILFLDDKLSYREIVANNRLFNITWDRLFFTKSTQNWNFSLCFARDGW